MIIRITFSLVLITLTFSCTREENVNNEVARWEEQASHVTIVRDDYGVPHIYGKTDADAVFGLLYAQCEDDFNRVERNYIWAIGRLAEVEGESELYSDLRARLFMTKAEAIANYESSPEWLKKLCNAFADGINYYLHKHPEVKPKLLTRFEPWMPMYFSEGSIGGDIERVSKSKIKAFYEDNASLTSANDEVDQFQSVFKEPKGSNGFAISGKHTESGDAMLLINPHTSFFFRGEVHVVSEEGLNAYGAVTWGQFFVYQGFNEKTGWMHTSTYTDVIDEFEETIIEEEDGLYYQYDDEKRALDSLRVTLKVKSGSDIVDRDFTIFRTHHGPITHWSNDRWTATALMWKPIKALTQSFIRTKQNNLAEFDDMMQMRTNSSNNTVYADASGNIAYYHGNFIPKRNTDYDYTKPVDGSISASDWNGLHEVNEAITVKNPDNGWIQNCNSTPFTSAAEYSPRKENYPKYMYSAPENFRGVHAIRLLKEIDDLTLDGLIDLAYDPSLPAFELLIPEVVKAYKNSGPKNDNLEEAVAVLDEWDYTVSEKEVAMTIAHFYAIQLLDNTNLKDEWSMMECFDYFVSDLPKQELIVHLEHTLNQLTADFGQWQKPWGDVNRYQRIDGSIRQAFNDSLPSQGVGMASASWGALASYGSRRYDTKKLYGTSGNSFVAVVEFGEKLKAKSLLAGGQSGDPNSPHFSGQVDNYINFDFKDVAFYKADVEKRAKRTYRPGE